MPGVLFVSALAGTIHLCPDCVGKLGTEDDGGPPTEAVPGTDPETARRQSQAFSLGMTLAEFVCPGSVAAFLGDDDDAGDQEGK